MQNSGNKYFPGVQCEMCFTIFLNRYQEDEMFHILQTAEGMYVRFKGLL
jgi:hypothetical protein